MSAIKKRLQKVAPAIIVITLGLANMTAFAIDEFYAAQASPAEAAAPAGGSANTGGQPAWKRVLVGICPLH